MIQSQSLIFGFVIIFGFIILWLIYANQKIEQKTDLFKNETPLILVDGKIPPKLSNFPAHLRYIDDATCLQCHATERKMNHIDMINHFFAKLYAIFTYNY